MPSPEACESLITPKTKAIVLVTPNNPVRSFHGEVQTDTDPSRLAVYILTHFWKSSPSSPASITSLLS